MGVSLLLPTFIGVSLSLQCTTRQASRGRAYSWACLHMDSTGGEAIHWRVFVTTVYDATGKQGAGLLMGVSLLLQCETRQAAAGGAIDGRVFVTTV